MSEKIVIITLCRKGSKRFPDKVRAPFLGIPLYMHTVNTALQLRYPYYFAHDYDSLFLPKEVIEIKRQKEFAGHEHKTNEEILSFKIDADIFIFLQVTSPLRDLEKIKIAINYFIKNDDLLCGILVKTIKNQYVYDGFSSSINFYQYDRTDNGCKYLKDIFIETGAFYIFRKSQLLQNHFLHCNPDKKFLIKDDVYSIDINTFEDKRKVEQKIEY